MAKVFDKYSVTRVTFGAILLIVFALVLYRVYAARNFELSLELACDPAVEHCFTRLCEEDCEEETEYYKLRTISARYATTCDPHFGDCPEVDCTETPTCVETYCDETTVSDGEWCTTPETFQGESASDLVESDGEAMDE